MEEICPLTFWRATAATEGRCVLLLLSHCAAFDLFLRYKYRILGVNITRAAVLSSIGRKLFARIRIYFLLMFLCALFFFLFMLFLS
jgi:hypothetical protein